MRQIVAPKVDNLPVGSFILWGSNTIPAKYLLVNQASLSRTTYSELFSVIGTAFGAADGNHFYLPPRGVFIRITAGGSGHDPDRQSRSASATGGNTGDNVGSFQGDMIGGHNHNYLKYYNHVEWASNAFNTNESTGDETNQYSWEATSWTGGNETRPKNVNFNLVVKYTV